MIFPGGFLIAHVFVTAFLDDVWFDYTEDFRWDARRRVYLCVHHTLEKGGSALGVDVYKGLREKASDEMDMWRDLVEGRRSIVRSYRVKAPDRGEGCLAWEMGLNIEKRYKHLVFRKGKFLVRISSELLTETSAEISWADLEAVGKVIEEKL